MPVPKQLKLLQNLFSFVLILSYEKVRTFLFLKFHKFVEVERLIEKFEIEINGKK
jgi:hypothetical protein